jgi:uncharacterized protein
MMRVLLLILGLLALPARAQPAPEALAAARELVVAQGAEQQIETTMQQMRSYLLQQLRQGAPAATDATLADVLDNYILVEVRAHSHEIIDATVLLWATHVSVEDMAAARDFQLSPAGQRISVVAPLINSEIRRFSQAWGQRVVAEAISKHREALRARGITL